MRMVKIKDRKKNIEILRMALNVAEISVNYETTDLILRVQVEQLKKGEKFTLKDGISLCYGWKRDWTKYYEDQNRLTEEDMDRIENEIESDKLKLEEIKKIANSDKIGHTARVQTIKSIINSES